MVNIISISAAREKLPTIINKVSEGLERFLITVNNQPKAVMLSLEELESLEETLEIMAIPGATKSIKRGLKEAKMGRGIAFSRISPKKNG